MNKFVAKLPNMITGTRLLLTLIFIILLIYGSNAGDEKKLFIPLFSVFTLICISDFIDGKVARAFKVASYQGMFFDIYADMLYVSSSCITLNILGMMPIWFTIIVFSKFIEFAITSFFMNNNSSGEKRKFIFDYIGRLSAAMFFLMPGITCVFYRFLDFENSKIYLYILFLNTFLAIFSSVIRVLRSCNQFEPLKKIMIKAQGEI